MSAASNRMRDKNEPSAPRHKAARLSPELDEVLRMLKALEAGAQHPEAPPDESPPRSDKPR